MKLGLFAFVEMPIHKISLNYENYRHEIFNAAKCDMGDTYDDAICCEYYLWKFQNRDVIAECLPVGFGEQLLAQLFH